MEKVNKGFIRYFMIFVQEDKGFGINNGPAAHLEIEIRSGKGNLTAWVENLKEMRDRYKYKLYLLSCGKKTDVVCVGRIYIKGNSGQLQWEFNPYNVSGTGLTFENFNTAVIIAEDIHENDEKISCPLASYREEKTDWRIIFKKYKAYKHEPTKTNSEKLQPVNEEIGNIDREISESDEKKKEPHYENAKSLAEIFDSNFTKYNPFNTSRKDYIWWKIDSPAQLNNILYQCNIKTPLLFNPTVMNSYFRYKHLIAGIFIDSFRSREYLVCGIPGKSNEHEKPFGNISKWVRAESNDPNLMLYGYWLIYTDINNGKLLNLI